MREERTRKERSGQRASGKEVSGSGLARTRLDVVGIGAVDSYAASNREGTPLLDHKEVLEACKLLVEHRGVA